MYVRENERKTITRSVQTTVSLTVIKVEEKTVAALSMISLKPVTSVRYIDIESFLLACQVGTFHSLNHITPKEPFNISIHN